MNAIRFALLLLPFLVLAANATEPAGSPQDADSGAPAAVPASGNGPAAPDPWRHLAGLLPREVQAGVQAGLLASRLRTSTEYAHLLEPTTPRAGAWKYPSWGAVITARWRRGFSLSLAPRYELYGLDTREETVAFPDNPFPHEMKARSRFGYTVWPLQAGLGWSGARQRVEVALGAYAAFLDYADIRWVVDGETYRNRPQVTAVDRHTGWLVSTGYGLRLGRAELFASVEAQQGGPSLLTGLEGSVRPRAVRASLGALWTISRR